MAPPRRRSSVGSVSVNHVPGAGPNESELQGYSYMGARGHRPGYCTGHTLKGGPGVAEWWGHPIYDANWREGVTQSVEALDYWSKDDQDFAISAFPKMVLYGDQLVEASGGYLPVVRLIQDMNLALQGTCAANVRGDRKMCPSMSDKLREILTVGVTPEFYGRIPENVGARGLPHEVQKTPEIAKKLRKLIRQRKAFACSRSKIRGNEGFPPTPSGLLEQKNPDRAASVDTRLISDLVSVNLEFSKSDLPPVWVPSIVDIVEEIQRRR